MGVELTIFRVSEPIHGIHLILDLDLPYRGFWVHFIVSEVARFMDHGWDPRAPPRSGISSTFTGPAGNEMGLVLPGMRWDWSCRE
jgi:hypothetical protein